MKFEMNKETLWTLKTDANTFLTNTGMVERKYSLLGYPVVINTNKPDGIVQLGRDSIDLTYTDNIRASLESLVHVAKIREGGLLTPQMIGRIRREAPDTVCIVGPGKIGKTMQEELMKSICRETPIGYDGETIKLKNSSVYGSSERASGRTFRALLEVMKTASESPEGSLTLFVVADDSDVYSSYGRLTHVMGRMLGNVLNDNKAKTLTFENRTIQVVSKNKMDFINHSFGKGKRINVVYDHTVQGN